MRSASIVVPTHNDPEGAFLTVASVMEQLEGDAGELGIIIVGDLGLDWHKIIPGWNQGLRFRGKSTKCITGRFGSPQAARDTGIRAAKGDVVVCLDSHVILSQSALQNLMYFATQSRALCFPAIAFYDRAGLSVKKGKCLAWPLARRRDL